MTKVTSIKFTVFTINKTDCIREDGKRHYIIACKEKILLLVRNDTRHLWPT